MRIEEYLQKLSGMHAPVGDEEQVANFLSSEFQKHGFTVTHDVLGNVIARRGKGKKVLVAAHMDELALAVIGITKEGFVKFAKIGGIYDGQLPSSRVIFHSPKGSVLGVIGMKPPHLMKDEEMKKLVEYDSMYIDVGASSKDEVEKLGIRPGTLATFDSSYAKLLNGLVVGKAFDDRSGCAVLLALALLPEARGVELCLVGTIREEVGLLGARSAAFSIEPDLAIAVDVTMASGSPDVSEDKVPVKLGAGPTLCVIEGGGRGLMMPKKLVSWIEAVAAKAKVRLQFEVSERGSSDASALQLARAGFLAASIGIPSRYIHSPTEMIALSDLEATAKLVQEIVIAFPNYK